MHVCVWYTELTCKPDVWPSRHYWSGPRPCVYVCACVGACMLVCEYVWYTELMCKPDVWASRHYGSGPRLCVTVCLCMCICMCMHACVCVVYRADVYTGCMAEQTLWVRSSAVCLRAHVCVQRLS